MRRSRGEEEQQTRRTKKGRSTWIGQRVVTNEAVKIKISRGQIMLGLKDHLRSLGFIL